MPTILISPHNDDETLFAAFTVIRESPLVAVVFDSDRQVKRGHAFCAAAARRMETVSAMAILGARGAHFCGLVDTAPFYEAVLEKLKALRFDQNPDHVFIPAIELVGNPEHNVVAAASLVAFAGIKTTRYLTYTPGGKSTQGIRVEIGDPEWIERKWKALACYKSQIQLKNTQDHFLREQYEYYAAD